MKGILVLVDGMGDLPCLELDGKTPLEAANTPNLDFLASRGQLGLMHPVKPGYIPESDEALMSIFSNESVSSKRGQFEARGVGIKLTRGDIACRINFASVDKKTGNILDRRVGRTLKTSEAEALSEALNRIMLSRPFEFQHTLQHRAVLVLRGGLCDSVSANDSGYFHGKFNVVDKISRVRSFDDSDTSQYTANVLNEFIEKASEVLENHPINKKRVNHGFFPANHILLRGCGTEFPKLKDYSRWMAIVYTPLEKGFAQLSNMNVFSFEYPQLTDLDAYENIEGGLKMACEFSVKMLKKNFKKYAYSYIHINETDLPGHDNKPVEKKLMLEYLDKTLFAFLKDFVTINKIPLVITANHSTPCKMKNHTADPVPVLFYNGSIPRQKIFSENGCKNGELGIFNGKDLIKIVRFDK